MLASVVVLTQFLLHIVIHGKVYLVFKLLKYAVINGY